MIIDAHAHIGKLPGSKFIKDFKKNLDFLLDEMRYGGVDHALILAGCYEDESRNISTKSLIKLTTGIRNISVVGSIDILNYKEGDLDELEQWLKDKSIVGVKLYTGYQHFYPNDERCSPVYKLCIKYGVPVIFHSGDTLAGYVENPKVKYSHPLNIDDTATDFPDLKIVIAHMGNPWLIDCAEIVYKNPNVYADISGLVVGDELETSYGDLMRARIKELITYVGINKLLFGTDFPLCPLSSYVKFAKSLDLPQKDQDDLFYKNTAKLFNLKI